MSLSGTSSPGVGAARVAELRAADRSRLAAACAELLRRREA